MVHILITCFYGILSILISAFISHGLKDQFVQKDLETLQIAARYLYWSAVPLLILFLTNDIWKWPKQLIQGFAIGGGIFSGSLILYVFFKIHWLVYFTPIGGVTLIIAWVALFLTCYKKLKKK